jgi:hypothetical protein
VPYARPGWLNQVSDFSVTCLSPGAEIIFTRILG